MGDAPEDECELEFRGFPLLFYWSPQRPVLLPFSPLTNCHPWLHMDVWLAGVSSVEGRGEQPRCSSRPVCVFKLSDSEWGKGVTLPSSDHHHASRDALNVCLAALRASVCWLFLVPWHLNLRGSSSAMLSLMFVRRMESEACPLLLSHLQPQCWGFSETTNWSDSPWEPVLLWGH